MSGGAGSLVTDDRGYFRMAGLPAGEYIVKVSENVNHSSNSTRGYNDPFESLLFGNGSMLTVFFENAFEKQNAKAISVAFGEEKPEISMMIPDRELHVIEGRIVAAKDKFPIRNSTIYLQRVGEETNAESPASNRLRQNCVTDENGNWKFGELPKGKYKLIAEADGSEFDDVKKAYGYANSNQAVNRSVYNEMSNRSGRPPARKFAKSIQEVTIEDKDISNKLIELNFGSVVAGTASTEDGKPMPTSVTVMVSNEEADISSSTQMSNYAYQEEQSVIKSSNEFQIQGVTPGKTYLTVVLNENSYYVKSVTAGNVDLLKEPFTIKDGEDLKNLKIVLSSDLGTLKGTIMNADKEPIPRLKIGLFPTDLVKYKNSTFYRSTVSNESGEFVTKLPPMEYAVIFLPAGFANMSRNDGQKWLANAMKDAQKFTIESGKTEKITIKHDTKKTEK